jgi:hypothetical protein
MAASGGTFRNSRRAYLQILNDLIAESHRKGTPAPANCDDEYWETRRANEAAKDKPREAA